MQYFQPSVLSTSKTYSETSRIFAEQLFRVRSSVDRGFSFLMIIQWVTAVVMGYFLTPITWLGTLTTAEENALLGFVFGGLFALPPVYCAWVIPGEKITRYAVTVGQSCFSILLIHLSGGRIETHFHIFVSLAALAFYQDLGVIAILSLVVIIDHFTRGLFLPLSIYGTANGVEWRWIEHTTWILVEDILVLIGIRRIRSGLWQMAEGRVHTNEAREKALRLSAMKSDFLSKMSHEIRTPLNSIIGFSDILRDTRLDREQSDYVETIHRCSDALLHLINDVLDLSKIENGLLQIDAHRFNMKEVLEDVRRMFLVQCQEKRIPLNIKIDPRAVDFALGDSYRIRQVLINLVGNAVKFTSSGEISIHLIKEKEDQVYTWEVSDTGPGIKEENLSRIFESFSQESAATARQFGGSGLGLYISKNLVELMGGRLSVKSKEGEGSTFSFTLHLEQA